MPKKNSISVLFFLNNFNDVDHMAPLIHRLLQDQCRVRVIGFKDYHLKNDLRMRDFKNAFPEHITIFTVGTKDNYLLRFARRITNFLLFNRPLVSYLLKRWSVQYCVSTWCDPISKGAQTRFILAAKNQGIKNYCFPHGHNIFLNHDVNTYLKKFYLANGRGPDFQTRNLFDLYVVQTEHHRVLNVELGMSPDRIKAWGCMRFTQKWIQFHRGLFPRFVGKNGWDRLSLKVTFFLPHWHYNVDKKQVYELLLAIAKNKQIGLVVKGHSRGDIVTENAQRTLSHFENVTLNAQAASCALTAWSDVVINFGSSIGLEAIVTGKVMVNPKYLHENVTVFDEALSVKTTDSTEETTEYLGRLASGEESLPPLRSNNSLIEQEVFGDNPNRHPIDTYRGSILLG
jgi:hypothetical protein